MFSSCTNIQVPASMKNASGNFILSQSTPRYTNYLSHFTVSSTAVTFESSGLDQLGRTTPSTNIARECSKVRPDSSKGST